jgi:hypothetical protein
VCVVSVVSCVAKALAAQVLVSSYQAGHVAPLVIDVLWRTLALTLSDATDADARHAVILLSMFVNADSKIIEERVSDVISSALLTCA